MTVTFCRLLAALGGVLVIAPALGAQEAARGPGVAAPTGALGIPAVEVRAKIYGPDVVRTARRFLGVRYRWGGSTPKAFDCSGFVRYVFAQHGIALPRTAREQAAVGDAPFPGDLEPGDLLFFYGGRGAQHIAIYVGGDSIIHASSTARRVRFDRLSGSRSDPSWFGRRLIAVRRVLPAEGLFRLPVTASMLSAPAIAAMGSAPAAGSSDRDERVLP